MATGSERGARDRLRGRNIECGESMKESDLAVPMVEVYRASVANLRRGRSFQRGRESAPASRWVLDPSKREITLTSVMAPGHWFIFGGQVQGAQGKV